MSLDYVQIRPEFAEGMVELEHRSFPHADRRDLLSVEGVLMQCQRFPEGAFVVLDGDRVVGMGLGCFVDFDFDQPQHHIDEVVGEYGCENHDPLGEWYYGTSIAVLPEYRGRGIGRTLYDLRKGVVQRNNRAGIVAGGSIPGYAEHRDRMSAAEYVEAVTNGILTDPTLTFQLANGFEARGVIAGYLRDDSVDSWASLIVWPNPDFDRDRFVAEKAAYRS